MGLTPHPRHQPADRVVAAQDCQVVLAGLQQGLAEQQAKAMPEAMAQMAPLACVEQAEAVALELQEAPERHPLEATGEPVLFLQLLDHPFTTVEAVVVEFLAMPQVVLAQADWAAVGLAERLE